MVDSITGTLKTISTDNIQSREQFISIEFVLNPQSTQSTENIPHGYDESELSVDGRCNIDKLKKKTSNL